MGVIVRPDLLYFGSNLEPTRIRWGYSEKNEDIEPYVNQIFAAQYEQPEETFHHPTIREDLELDVLIDKAFKPEYSSDFVKQVITAASNEEHVIRKRQDSLECLLGDVDSKETIEGVAESIFNMISLFVGIDEKERMHGYVAGSVLSRQVTLLTTYTNVIEKLSGLSGCPMFHELSRFAEQVKSTPDYQELQKYRQAFHERYVVTMEAVIDAAGHVNSSVITGIKERTSISSGRLVDVGGRKLFGKLKVDDYQIVSTAITGIVNKNADQMTELTFLLGQLDFYLSSLNFYETMREKKVNLEVPKILSPEECRAEIQGMRNPLLLYKKGARNVEVGTDIVPNPFGYSEGDRFKIVTGPNSGGKTVLIKGLGVCYLLSHNGIRMPSEGERPEISVIDDLYTILVSTEKLVDNAGGQLEYQGEKIREMLRKVTPHSLVLLDEIGRGTSEDEGTDFCYDNLVYPLVDQVEPIQAAAYLSTHLHQLAERCEDNPSVTNMQAEIIEGEDGLEPTYKIIPGRAEKSYAYLVEQRVGLGMDKVDELLATRRREGSL